MPLYGTDPLAPTSGELAREAASVDVDGAAPRGEWPDLRADIAALSATPGPSRPARVAIASYEFVGVVRNGGIGTACTELALALARDGHEVDLFFTGWLDERGDEEFDRWVRRYDDRGVRLQRLDMSLAHACDAVAQNALRSLALYRMLAASDRERPYDAIHFVESVGHGYFSLLAKRQGLAFGSTTMVVGTHSPRRWLAEAHGQPLDHPIEIGDEFLERRSLELTDVVVSPSAHMLDWLRGRGCALPPRSYVQQYVTAFDPVDQGRELAPIEELVFFGRLEPRKGIGPFCDALDILAGYAKPGSDPSTDAVEVSGLDFDPTSIAGLKRITFLGKESVPPGYLAMRAERWPWQSRVISDYDRDAALAFLQRPGRLAVMASTMDNSPNAVYEALGLGIPFLASRGGGTAELVHPDDFDRVTYDPRDPELQEVDASDPTRTRPKHSGRVLAPQLARVLAAVPRPARFAVQPTENCETHLAWHRMLAATAGRDGGPNGRDGSERDPAPSLLTATIDALPDLALSDAEQLLLLDPEAQPGGRLVEILASVAATRPDVSLFTSLGSFDVTRPGEAARYTFVPSGGPGAIGVVGNCAGTGAVLIRRSAWERLGLLAQDGRAPRSVAELLARATLIGEPIDVVPEVLYHVPAAAFPGEMLSTGRGREDLLRPYYLELPAAVPDIVAAAARIFGEEHGLRAAAQDSAERLAVLSASRSLRMTAPFRRAGTKARRLRQRFRR